MQKISSLGAWQLVPLVFAQDTVAASQAAVAIKTTDGNNSVALNTSYTMPFPGEIIAISSNLDTAGTAGTLTIKPTIAGVVVADPVIAMTTLAYGSDTCQRGAATFAKNGQVGCKITTTANWNGTTRDLQVIVWVLLKIDSI